MDQVNIFRRYGLFDTKVPRYTSYPPANRFESGAGAMFQRAWLKKVPVDEPISVYVHIPFCRRLCWFCACRTQGTQTLKPVEAYVKTLREEIAALAQNYLPKGLKVARLHLGGGTPTLLSGELMQGLIGEIDSHFEKTSSYEFSVEIDPTEAADEVLDVLSLTGMARASIGVQDFDLNVQKAIGRLQSFEETQAVVTKLRAGGVKSLNIDLLYGLPYQTNETLSATLDQVAALQPDRLALYGYAHVPHMSKRQVMIPSESLPEPEARYELSQLAKEKLLAMGYVALGIDHFALPEDSLTIAAHTGKMGRNFQGYTDDPCETLIGFGASAISKFHQGYLQNAVSTSAYVDRVTSGGLAAHKGFALSTEDRFVAALIDGIMCNGELKPEKLLRDFPEHRGDIKTMMSELIAQFPDFLARDNDHLWVLPEMTAAARLIAAYIDRSLSDEHIHSLAV